jgi:RNA polymerase sigma factor (sigma-70 family)
MAGQYGDKGISLDERRSAAFDGLVLASRRYDPKRGPFGPYAKLWIKGEITALLKDAKRHRAKSLADPAFKDDDDGENFLERFVIDESTAFNPDVSDLTAKERRIILGRVSGETLSETGKALDVSAERVRQIEVRAWTKLRKGEPADPVKVACGDSEARQFCREYKTYHGNFGELKLRKGYQKPRNLGWSWSKAIEDKQFGSRSSAKVTTHLSGAEKQRWLERLRNAETTDWGRKTGGNEKRFGGAVDGVNGPTVSWKRLQKNCGLAAVENARRKTPKEHLHKFLTHHQLERFRFDIRAKLCGEIEIKRPSKGPWCWASKPKLALRNELVASKQAKWGIARNTIVEDEPSTWRALRVTYVKTAQETVPGGRVLPHDTRAPKPRNFTPLERDLGGGAVRFLSYEYPEPPEDKDQARGSFWIMTEKGWRRWSGPPAEHTVKREGRR